MATLSSRLVISLTDRLSGPAKGIVSSLKSLTQAATSRPLVTLHNEARSATSAFNRMAGSATAAGFGLWGFINATREFNEAKFGYGMAQIPEYLKDGEFNAKGLKLEMEAAAKAARQVGRELGTFSERAMVALAETTKLGFKDNEAESIWLSALGLSMADSELASGEAAKFLGTLFRAYEKQRDALAKEIGADPADKAFVDAWVRGMAAKAAVAAAESSLGPADLVQGLRQYAPQWAQLGMAPEFAMAMLAHGANFGFRAPELGTAFKSMANRLVKPTAEGLRWLNALGIDRTKFMNVDAADPDRATNQLNSLLGGSLGKNQKRAVRQMLDAAQRAGTTGTPEFQEELTQRIAEMLGRRTEQDIAEIQQAVANATLSSGGQVDVDGLIRALIAKGAGPAALMAIFEGRHYARNTPIFEFYDKMYALYEKLLGVDARTLDAIIETRKDSEAGTADALAGAFKDLLLALQETGVIEGVKNGLIAITDALRALPPQLVKNTAELFVLGSAITVLGGGLVFAARAARMLYTATIAFGRFFGIGAALRSMARGLSAVVGALLGRAGFGHDVVGSPILTSAKARAAGAGAGGVAGRMLRLGKAIALGAGRFFIPGLGVVMTAYGGYEAYKAYQRSGSLFDAVMAFVGLGGADAAEAEKGGDASAAAGAAQAETAGGAQTIAADVRSAMAEVQSILASVDLTAEGRRIIESLANGMRAGIPAVTNAARAAADAAARAAVREAFSDGGLR